MSVQIAPGHPAIPFDHATFDFFFEGEDGRAPPTPTCCTSKFRDTGRSTQRYLLHFPEVAPLGLISVRTFLNPARDIRVHSMADLPSG